jgi:hypothetical protein
MERLHKLGYEKIKVFNKDFDFFYDKYRKIALEKGYKKELKFIKEKGKMLIYVVI